MKNKKDIYIFDRIAILAIVLAILLFLSVIYIGVNSFRNNNYLFLSLYIIGLTIISYLVYKWILIPYKEINKTLRLFHKGYIFKGIFDMRMFFNEEIYLVLQRFKDIIDTKEFIEGSKKHAQFLALQNQINPHFLYNTLEGIRSEALIEGVDSIANMTESLAIFYRYTISDVDKFVTLQAEIDNILNYYKIQEFRFGDKLELKIDIQEEDKEKILNAKVPKLTLQPFFENAIFHGVERKMGKGVLTLRVTATKERLIIVVSDNGVGMDEKRVRDLNKKLRGASLEYMKEDGKKGGIALINVNSRIKLVFGDEYGVYIYSRLNAGTDVEITIPFIK